MENTESRSEAELEDIKIEFKVRETPVSMVMSVPVGEVRLRRMLPVLRKVSNSFGAIAEANVRESGAEISCKAGCGACCRQLVPVSEAEAFDLREQIDAMPEPRRSVVTERFRAGFETLHSSGFFERLDTAAAGDEAAYGRVVNEYFTFGIACPFLEDESCSIHETRPVTCREYLVTSPPELCNSAEGVGVKNVRHYFKLKEAVINAGRALTTEELPYVPLISVLHWTDANTEGGRNKTGREWMGEIFGFLLSHTDEGVTGE